MSGYPAVFQLSSLNGTNGFRLDGVAAHDYSGFSVSSAGDINGDGFADLIVGAFGADANGTNSGASHVVFGRSSGFAASLNLSSLDGNTGYRISGAAPEDASGFSVSAAGDVNGDGFGDVIIGAPNADPNGRNSGASYVVFGKASGFAANLNLSSLNGANGFRINGVTNYDQSGVSVSSAGDVNGDGFDDLIVGAYAAETNGPGSGASYVVFGKASGFAANFNLSSLNGTNGFRLSGEADSDYSGFSVSSAGDFNGDGFDDVIAGAHNADPNGISSGTSYVVFGKASGFAANLELSSLDGNNGFRIHGEAAQDESGFSVSAAGDVNGDGRDDLIVGAHRADPNGIDSGASYVIFGKAGGLAADLELSSLDGTNGFKISGQPGGSGRSVSSAGDVNGDGFADVIIGAFGAGSSSSGASYVVFGKAGGLAANVELSALDGTNGFRLDGVAAQDWSGWSVAGAGDVNGDGFGDLIVGARRADPNGLDSGSSYVIFGQRAQAAVTIDGTAIGLTHNGGIGNDTITGRGGNDTLKGWESNDRLNGGAGNDIIIGGAGRDAMTGGGGKDVFVFDRLGDSGTADRRRDVITEFTVNPNAGNDFIDRIDVAAIDASKASAGNNAFVFIGQAGFTAEGQIRATQSGADTLVEFNTRDASGADMAILLRNFTATDLTAADFIL